MAEKIIGWQGLVIPYATKSPLGEERVVYKSELQKPYRTLPLPVKIQWSSAPGHDNAEQGLANITRVWTTDEGLMASGWIDTDTPRGEELAAKIHKGFLGWVSADLDTDGGGYFRDDEGRRRRGYTKWELTGITLVADSAFDAARIQSVTDPDQLVRVEEIRSKDLVGAAAFSATHSLSFTIRDRRQAFVVTGDVDLPWANRDREWDGLAAARRVQDWADGDVDRMSRAFLWRNPDADPTTQAAYSLGFADIVDGELRAVFRGVAAAAGRLGQTRNGTTAADRDRIASRIDTLYERAASAFDDPDIRREEESMAKKDEVQIELAVTDPADDVMADTLPGSMTLSEEDISRIADAVVARLDARDNAMLEDFARKESIRAALGGDN